MVWGGRREEDSGWGTHVYLWQIHFDIWQNEYNIVKLIKLKKQKHKYFVFISMGIAKNNPKLHDAIKQLGEK